MKSLYLLLDMATLFFPLLLSFDKKVAFYKQWKYLFPAIAVTALVFIAWDVYFAWQGVWQFSNAYTLGFRILGLPFEEWLFFLSVPYACVFIYEVCRVYIGKPVWARGGRVLAGAAAVLLIGLGIVFHTRIYTCFNFCLAGLLLAWQAWRGRYSYLGVFWLAYLIQLLPFLLVNGILTGSFIASPVVMYNDAENLGLRIFTIPLEDMVYSLSLLLLPVSILELLRSRK